MRRQIVRRSGGTLVLLLGFAAGLKAQRDPGPDSRDRQRYAAEAAAVSIVRDKWGIPHIYGRTDADVVFGLMYAECENDFSRVEKNYLEMLGRQAEAFGESYLYNDVMMRLIYDSAQAQAEYTKSPVWMRRLLDAFADGVNYYLYRHPAAKPMVLRHFEPWYALMFTDGSVSATSTGGIKPEEIRQFYGGDAAGDGDRRGAKGAGHVPAAGDGEVREGGSNGFAIAPAHTADGHALLYINPHVPYYFRMEVQLVSEEGLNAYGAVTWGQFFIYQGFNAHCGWMHTSSYADVADLYEEKTSRNGGGWVYAYEGGSRPVKSRVFTVSYKKGDRMMTVPVTGYYTHHGPVLASRDGKWISLKEYNRSLNALQEAWQITKANSFAEYKAAMDIRANTTNNTVYADDRGNIAYWHGNFMPRRDPRYNWALPVDGSIAATEWKGTHALDEIVHVYNPATGWIQNCNATPFTLSGSSSPVKDNYPSYMAPEGENFRGLNAVRLFSGAGHLTLDSLIAKGYDKYLTAFDMLIPALLEAYKREAGGDERLRESIALLAAWDRRAGEHSVATTLAVEWGMRMATVYAPGPKLSDDAPHAVDNVKAEIAAAGTKGMLSELSAVLGDLQMRFGTWKMEWGSVCRYQRLTGKITETYDDAAPSLPVGLVSSAFGALPSVQSRVMKDTKKRYAYSGNSFIAAVEFGPRLRARTIVTGGESSDPGSVHFADQAEMYLEGRFKDVLFYKEEVLAAAERTYHPGE